MSNIEQLLNDVLDKVNTIEIKVDELIRHYKPSEGIEPTFALGPPTPPKPRKHELIVDMFEEEFTRADPKFRIRSRQKWLSDAKKLEKLGYTLDDLRDLVKFVVDDDESGSGDWRGWKYVIRNIDAFRRSIAKIEAALDRKKEYTAQRAEKGSSGASKWL